MAEPDIPLSLPFSGQYAITQGYGVTEQLPTGPAEHMGIDWGMPCGTPVHAAADGIVDVVAIYNPTVGYGIYVKIRHTTLITLYGHLSSVGVKQGQTVKRGEQIALSGKSGWVTGSTGCHLHFGVIEKGLYINPLPLMNQNPPIVRHVPLPSDKLVPVYRLYNPTTNDHFYTTSGDEADAAVKGAGYTYEGVLGFVHAAA